MSKFPYEAWTITENGFQPENLRENESAFALGNGFLGMRGNLEELKASGAMTIQGSFLNGVFDSEPIVYGEGAYGYAKNHETICNVMDAKSLTLTADGERLDLGVSHVEAHVRQLDMKEGLLRRSFRWFTAGGAILDVQAERLISLTRQELAVTGLRVRCVEGNCCLTLESGIKPAVIAEGDPNDPRNAAGKDRRLLIGEHRAEGGLLSMEQKTKNTGFTIACAVEHRSELPYETDVGDEAVLWKAEAHLAAGSEISLEKSICYTVTRKTDEEAEDAGNSSGSILAEAKTLAKAAPALEKLKAEQKTYLDSFWENAGIEIEGDDALLQGLRFNLFHLLQSAGRDGKRNIAAKGLTGEGYEGHTFWDTEAYVLPMFLCIDPAVARKLLEYRYMTLPNARGRARILGHCKGALYPWRTIDGEECSAYFPGGTAQYHIDGDIAHAVLEYWRYTRDLDFMAQYGTEILVETARLYRNLGFYSEAKGGLFVINEVTGPDEYNALVNNNTYTNLIASETMRGAAEMMALMKEQRQKDYQRLCSILEYTEEEAQSWLDAADCMYYPAPKDGIYPQDDGFLEREPWPLDSIPKENHPLLMYYHGLVIYRHMVCKQADLILAMSQYGERYTLEEKKKNFAFYDSVTTHDSSLSMATFSILACEIGDMQKAYDYFMSSARLDLDDTHHNTKDGLHMANMAGTVNGIMRGFGGMRVRSGQLCFAPICPPQWKGYSFRVQFCGRSIQAHVTPDGAEYRLLQGKPLTVLVSGEERTLQ